KADVDDRPAVSLAHQLPEVELALARDVGSTGVAQVRVVRPHDDLGAAVPLEVARDGVERLGHVAIAPVPGVDVPAELPAVIVLGGAREARMLLAGELLVLGGDRAV